MNRFYNGPVFAPDDGGGSAGGSPAPSGSGVSTPSSPSSGASPSAAPASPSPAPSSSPAPATPTPIAPGAAPSREPPRMSDPVGNDIFSGFDTDEEGDDVFGLEPQVAPVVEPLQPQPQQVQPQPAAPPVIEGQQPQTPAAAPTGQQGQAPQGVTSPLPTHAEPGKIADALFQNRDAIIDHLAATQFKLSQAEAEALETDAVGAIPKIMARVFVEAQTAAMRQMQQVIPAMTSRISELNKRNDENAAKFYARWPDLKADLHGDAINRLARTYRQMNPQNTLDQMIEELGPIAMMTLKVQPGAVGHPVVNGGLPPGAPPRRPPAPFRPAGAGPGGPSPVSSADPWSGLGGDYGEQD